MTYQVGDQVKVAAAFTNAAGAAADPSAVVFKVRAPSGTVTTYTYGTDADVVKTATGAYYLLLTLSASELWYVRAAGTGAVVAADESVIRAEKTYF